MFNFSIISLISLILIYQNILLLNEETLILICFLIFCSVGFTKFSSSFYVNLQQDSKKIEDSLKISLDDTIKNLNINLTNQKKLQNLPKNFETLGNHYFKLSTAISNELPSFLDKKSENIYAKKFLFIQRLEKQTVKLLAILITRKLNKLVIIQKFYTHELKISSFVCFQNIILLKYLKNI